MIEQLYGAVIGWIVSNILNRFFFKSRTTSQIIAAYELRLREKDWSIAELHREQLDQVNERHRIVSALKRSALSTSKIITKYDRPLNAILISYASQKEETTGGRLAESHFIRPELERFNVKYLGGTDSLIPPANVPKHIKSNKDLEEWFESEILKGRYCKLKFLVLVDLRKKAYWYSNLPYAQTRTSHHSIGEVLNIEDLFTEEQISKIALSDFVRNGDIAWLIADYLSADELAIIHRNQTQIESELGNPSLRLLSDDKLMAMLSSVLARYNITNPNEVAKAIVEEAKFWHSKLR